MMRKLFFLLLLFLCSAQFAQAQCIPPEATQGMAGCFPPNPNPNLGTYVWTWEPSLFPDSATLTTLGAIAGVIGSGSGGTGLPPGTNVTVLHGNSAGPPFFGPINLTTDVIGVLPIANGGEDGSGGGSGPCSVFGTTAGTCAQGNDSRIVNALQPSSPAFSTPTISGVTHLLGALSLDPWTTGTRPASPAAGWSGYNSTTGLVEFWNGSAWIGVTAGSGGAPCSVFGTTAGTCAQGNDTRIVNALQPAGPVFSSPVISGTTTLTGTLAVHPVTTGTLPVSPSPGWTVFNSTTGFLTTWNGSSWITDGGGSTSLPPGTTTTVLHGNASGPPSYSAINLATDVSGNLPVIHGGTGASDADTARANLRAAESDQNRDINSMILQSPFPNFSDGSQAYAYIGAPPDAGYVPNGMQLTGGLSVVSFPYGEDQSAINLLLLANTSSSLHGAWGSFIAGGVQQLAAYLTSDLIGEANEVDPSPPLMTLTVSAYSGSIVLTTTASTTSGNVLHFGPGNVPPCIMQPVGVSGLNIPTTGAFVGFPNTTVISVDYIAGNVSLSNNVTGTVPAGTSIVFGAGRANLATPLTPAQLDMMRRYMTVETLNPHSTSLISNWDVNGTWVETIGWATDGNPAFGQVPTSATLYVGYHNAYFTRNTIVIPCDPVGDPTCDLTANGSVGDEIDVFNIHHFYDFTVAPSGGGISIFAFESTGLSPAADSAIGIAGPFESAFVLSGIAQSGYYITARNDGGMGQGSSTGQLNWIVSAYDGSQVIGNLSGTPSSPCFSMATVGGDNTNQHDIDFCGGFGNVGVPDSGFAFLHVGGLEIISPDQTIDNLSEGPTDGNSLYFIPAGLGNSSAIGTHGDAAGQITIVPSGGATSGQLTLDAKVFIPPLTGTAAYSICENSSGQIIARAGVNCFP